MPTRTPLLVALVCSVLYPSSTEAQIGAVGSKVRFRTEAIAGGVWHEATLGRTQADTVWVRHEGQLLALPLASAEVQVRTEATAAGKGFRVGLLVGAAVGGLLGALTHEPRFGHGNLDVAFGCAFGGDCPPKTQQNSRGGDAASGALSGALVGGLLGWLTGRTIPEWATLTATPEAGSYQLSAAVYF